MERRILVIDDEIIDRGHISNLLAAALRGHGITVETADSVEKGLELMGKIQFDQIVTDGLKGGYRQIIKNAALAEPSIPTFVLTADPFEVKRGIRDYQLKVAGVVDKGELDEYKALLQTLTAVAETE